MSQLELTFPLGNLNTENDGYPKGPITSQEHAARLSLAECWIAFLGWLDEGHNHGRSVLKE